MGNLDFILIAAMLLAIYVLPNFWAALRGRQKASLAEPSPAVEYVQKRDIETAIVEEPESVLNVQPEEIEEAVVESGQAPQAAPQRSINEALSKTRSSFMGRIKGLFSGGQSLDLEELDDLEEILYTSDLGPKTVQRMMGAIEENLSRAEKKDYEAIRGALKNAVSDVFKSVDQDSAAEWETWARAPEGAPLVLMIVGVNGAGKTTTIGKLSKRFADEGRKVLVAAGDTFRAAAGDQLKVWSDRAEVEIFSPEGITDPSAVAYDACQHALAKKSEVVIIDTAGRLHTQSNLMEELKKMKRVIAKSLGKEPDQTLLVLDANSGQNALVQAENFHKALEVSGVVLTKLDGSAKGGVAVGVACELSLPIRLVGVGEGINDLRPFQAQEFVDSLI